MSYYQYQTPGYSQPPPQPQRSYTAGPQPHPAHSHSHSVPTVYPNSPYSTPYPTNALNPAVGAGYTHPYPQATPHTHPPSHLPAPGAPVSHTPAPNYAFLPTSQPILPQQSPQPPLARSPSPFRRALPTPQRSDPVPRSLTPGLSSPTSPSTTSFSNSASTFSSSSSLGFGSSGSGSSIGSGVGNVRPHSHSYSMSDTIQKGPSGSFPSPYPTNWASNNPSHPAPNQPHHQPATPQQYQQHPQQHQPQSYWPNQQSYSQPQPGSYPPQQPPQPATYAPQHSPINIGVSVRSSGVFPPPQQFTGSAAQYTTPGPTNSSPIRSSTLQSYTHPSSNPVPTIPSINAYAPPTSSSPTRPNTVNPNANSSPTRRPLPTPGPNSRTPGPNNPNTNSSALVDRVFTRSPSPIKSNSNNAVPVARSQSPVKAIRDMFEAKIGNNHSNNNNSHMSGMSMGMHAKGWSEDSDNGVTGGDGERGRTGFGGISGGRRASPPKFFDSVEGGGDGHETTVKLVSSSSSSSFPPSSFSSGNGGISGSDINTNPATTTPSSAASNSASIFASLPPASPAPSQDGGTKFVPLWKRGKPLIFNNVGNNTGSGTVNANANVGNFNSVENGQSSGNAAAVHPANNNNSSSNVGPTLERSNTKSRALPQPGSVALSRSRSQSQSQSRLQPKFQPQSHTQPPPQQPAPSQIQSQSQRQPQPPPQPQHQPQAPSQSQSQFQPQSQPQIRSQPQPRAQPQARSRSQGPPSASQKQQKQQESLPITRGAPKGWKSTVNIRDSPPSPPLATKRNHHRSRSMGPPAQPFQPPAQTNSRAPTGWRTTVSPSAKPPPPDVDPRTGAISPPKHKPPEGWKPTVPTPSRSNPPSPKKAKANKNLPQAEVPQLASRAPEGWRSTVHSNSNIPGPPSPGGSGGAPAGWRSTVAVSNVNTQIRRGNSGMEQMGREQKKWSQPAPTTGYTPRIGNAPPTGGYNHSQQLSTSRPGDGDSSFEYDSGDAYSGMHEDDEEGDSSFDASTTNGTTATGDEETDGASMLSRDTGNTDETEDSLGGSNYDYRGRKVKPPPSPQYGILDLPKKGVGASGDVGPPSPQYGIRDLPARRNNTGNEGASTINRENNWGGVGPLPRPPAMVRGGGYAMQGESSQTQSRPQSVVSRMAEMNLCGDSDAGSDVGSRRNSGISYNSKGGPWPADVPRLPRAPGSASREMFDLDDAPPVGASALRRTPSPAPIRLVDDYDGGDYGGQTKFPPHQTPSRAEPPQLPPRQASPPRPPTTHSYGSNTNSRPPSRLEQQLPPRQASPARPLPQPSQLQRSRSQSQRSQPQFQTSQHQPNYSTAGTPSSYSSPLPPRQQSPTRAMTPQHQQEMPKIEIQSPAPVSGWDRSDLPKIEVTDGSGDNEEAGAPAIAVSAPTISISGIGDDDDGMGPMISVSGPVDGSSNKDSSIQEGKPQARRPLPPIYRGGGLICGGCGRAIVGRIVSAMGLKWHPECFRCTVCDELLEHVSSYEHEGRPYCHLDYHENFAPRCYSCKTAIIEERFISLDDPALGKRTYHEQHFFCAECGDPFLSPSASNRRNNKGGEMEVNVSGDGEFVLDDDVGFTVYQGHPYCEACHVRLRMPKCKKCKKSIRDGMQAVEALGGKWCWECFVCAGCERPFEDPSFFQRGDKPFCERCFSIILRNEL